MQGLFHSVFYIAPNWNKLRSYDQRFTSKFAVVIPNVLLFRPVIWYAISLIIGFIAFYILRKKLTVLQTDNSFHFSDKKATCLARAEIKTWGIPTNKELYWTFLSIFSKRNIFLHFRPIQDGHFRGCSLIGKGTKSPPP